MVKEHMMIFIEVNKMKKEQGITLVSVVVMIVILAIIASLSIITSTRTVNEAKDLKKEENIVMIQAVVNRVGAKLETAGYLTPADTKIYGKRLNDSIISELIGGAGGSYSMVNGENIEDWYVLEQDDLEEMGVSYVNESYFVNYHTGEVYPKEEFANKMKGSIISF